MLRDTERHQARAGQWGAQTGNAEAEGSLRADRMQENPKASTRKLPEPQRGQQG